MTGIPTPFETAHAALQAIDTSLENVGLAADAVHTSFSPLPPVTSDYDKAAHSTYVSKGIDAVRAQVRRGLPITANPLALIVRMPTCSPKHTPLFIL